MHTYNYTIQATKDVNKPYSLLSGVIHSEYELPRNKLREIAINQCPLGYISFGLFKIVSYENTNYIG